MKILANQKIKALFCKILLYIIGFSVFFIVFMGIGSSRHWNWRLRYGIPDHIGMLWIF